MTRCIITAELCTDLLVVKLLKAVQCMIYLLFIHYAILCCIYVIAVVLGIPAMPLPCPIFLIKSLA